MAFENIWTHYIECFLANGSKRKKRIYQKCKFIRWSKSGQAVVRVEDGIRDNKGYTRYVDKDKLIPMYESVG